MIDAVRNAAGEFQSWVAQLKLYWQIPIVMGIAVTATSLLLAIYEVLSTGKVYATFVDEVTVASLILVVMAFCMGLWLEWVDNHSRRAE